MLILIASRRLSCWRQLWIVTLSTISSTSGGKEPIRSPLVTKVASKVCMWVIVCDSSHLHAEVFLPPCTPSDHFCLGYNGSHTVEGSLEHKHTQKKSLTVKKKFRGHVAGNLFLRLGATTEKAQFLVFIILVSYGVATFSSIDWGAGEMGNWFLGEMFWQILRS